MRNRIVSIVAALVWPAGDNGNQSYASAQLKPTGTRSSASGKAYAREVMAGTRVSLWARHLPTRGGIEVPAQVRTQQVRGVPRHVDLQAVDVAVAHRIVRHQLQQGVDAERTGALAVQVLWVGVMICLVVSQLS